MIMKECVAKAETMDFHKRQYVDRLYRLPPYHFTVEYNRYFLSSSRMGYKNETEIRRSLALCQDQLTSDRMTLVELDPGLVSMVESTDNSVFYRPLFLPQVFINNEFYLDNYIIKGIMIMDLKSPEVGDDWRLFFIAVNPDDDNEFTGDIKLMAPGLDYKNMMYDTANESKMEQIHTKISDRVRILAVNVIDMIENQRDMMSVQTIEKSDAQNAKRERRGKIRLPTKVIIRPKGAFIAQVDQFNKVRTNASYSHMFMVRGHWKHFRSLRYTPEKRGTKTWVIPFYKGSGLLVSKDYEVKDEARA